MQETRGASRRPVKGDLSSGAKINDEARMTNDEMTKEFRSMNDEETWCRAKAFGCSQRPGRVMIVIERARLGVAQLSAVGFSDSGVRSFGFVSAFDIRHSSSFKLL